MKILVISNLFPPDFLGGYELGCAQMVEALRQRGHDVMVVTSESSNASKVSHGSVARALTLSPIYNIDYGYSGHAALREHVHLSSSIINQANVHSLADIIDDYAPDLAYLWNLLGLGGLGILALLKHLSVPWVWHIMDIVPRLLCGLGGDALPPLAREFGVLGDGTYIVCSTRVAEENRWGGVTLGPRVHLLPNWVTDGGSEGRTDFFSGGELRLMNAVGVLGEHKGTHILIGAAARLHDLGYANFRIDMYGRDVDPRFRAMLYKHDVADVVRFVGSRAQPDLLELYPEYDVFAFPTWAREPFGFAPLEAAAFGCVPLISADCGIAEWLVDGVHCLKADRTVDAFADGIVQILRGEIDLVAMGRRTQAVVRRDFGLDALMPRIERVLYDAASQPKAPARDAAEFNRLARFADGLLPSLLAEALP
jgi:glycosyltransferase involved in cell wall biosynthesis